MKNALPLSIVTISLGIGIVLARFLPLAFSVIAFLTFVCFAFAFIFLKKPAVSSVLAIAAFILLGIFLTQNDQYFPPSDVSYIGRFYRGKDVRVEGVIVSDIQRRDFHNTKKLTFELAIRRFKTKWGWREKSGKILVHVFGDRDLAYGTVVRLTGKLYRAFNFKTDSRFSYKEYLLNKKIAFLLSVKTKTPVEVLGQNRGNRIKAISLTLKHQLNAILGKYLSVNEAFLMQAILTGDRYQIPRHIKDLFVQTGTAHILAISGLHAGIVAFLFFFLLKLFPLGRKARALAVILFLIFYAILTGARPSVVRATIMAVIYLSSFLAEREGDTLNSLCLAAFLILCVHPVYLFDIGFQLSFLSVLSILILYPVIVKHIPWEEKKHFMLNRFFVHPFLISFSVWLGIGMLMAYYFQMVSPITIVANLFVIPCLSVIVALGMGLLLTGLVWPWAAMAFAVCLKVVINLTVAGTYLLSQIPGAYFALPQFPLYFVWIYYAILAIIFLIRPIRNRLALVRKK